MTLPPPLPKQIAFMHPYEMGRSHIPSTLRLIEVKMIKPNGQIMECQGP